MRLFHDRWRRRVGLLAAGDTTERVATLRHLEGCGECRDELRLLQEALSLLDQDEIQQALPPIPFGAFAARVHAQLDAAPVRRASWVWAAAAVTAVGALLAPLLWHTQAPAQKPEPVVASVPDEMVERMERQMTRDQAVRYLSQAQAVLVGVVATPSPCPDAKDEHVDLAEEARRSRELLARRALMLEVDALELAGARPVLDDVEHALRAVAALESCARTRDLRAIHDELEQRRLLMKIDLMTRELQG
jgi:hypothetical protein